MGLNRPRTSSNTALNVGAINANNSTGTTGQYLESTGTGTRWTTVSGATLSDNTTTNSTFYPTLSSATSGSYTTAVISSTKLTFNPSTGLLTGTSINDSAGNLRDIPQNAQTSAYILVASDAGKHISITTGGVTVNASVFSAGQAITIYNNSGSNQTITQGGSVTLRQAGTANTGNRTLAQYGIATILCVTGGATPTFVISGAGLT